MNWEVRENYDYQGLQFRTKVSSFTVLFLLNTSNMVNMFLSVFVFSSISKLQKSNRKYTCLYDDVSEERKSDIPLFLVSLICVTLALESRDANTRALYYKKTTSFLI